MYKEIAGMDKYYEYEIELLKKSKQDIAEKEFTKYLKFELADCAGCNFEINRKRTEDIAKAKKGIFFLIISTLLLFMLYLFYLLNLTIMSDDKSKTNESPKTETTTSEVNVQGPKSIYIQNKKEEKSKKK